MDPTIQKRPPNINPDTGVPYGVIQLDKLDPDLVDTLLYGSQATNLSWEAAKAQYLDDERNRLGSRVVNDDLGHFEQAFADMYSNDEEIHAGIHEDVQYQTFWLGGAPHLYVFKSPIISPCAPCSPCVPNAGSLGTVGGYEAYDVPASWLREDM